MRNESGIANPTFYKLGKGIVYAAVINASTGLAQGFRDLGNAPAFAASLSATTLKHISSRTGLGNTDKEVSLSQDAAVSFTLDEVTDENLALFFSGSEADPTNAAVAGFTIHTMIPDGQLEAGLWYDIVNAAGERAMDIDAGDLNIDTHQGTPVAMVEGTDYTVDEEMGRIFIIAGTVVNAAIAAGKGVTVVLAAKAEARDIQEVKGLTTRSVTLAIKFIAEDPETGVRDEYNFRKVLLSADGDFSLIGTDWTQMKFKGSLQANVSGYPDSPYLSHLALPAA